MFFPVSDPDLVYFPARAGRRGFAYICLALARSPDLPPIPPPTSTYRAPPSPANPTSRSRAPASYRPSRFAPRVTAVLY